MSGNLNTKDVKVGGANISKTLQPGNTSCKITGVSLEDFKFKPGGYHLLLHMEGKDLGSDFEGFFIDKDKPELGRHKGQVGKVKAGEWAFADGSTKSGIAVSRDGDILKFIKSLCMSLGITKWFDDQHEKHANIESFVKAFNDEKPFAGKYQKYCIAGKEYINRQGYSNYELFLPKFSKNGVPFEAEGVTPSKLLKFNEAEHIRKRKVENVDEFGPNTGGAPEFDLEN